MGIIVLTLQVVERRRRTIKYFARELRNDRTARRSEVSQGSRQCKGSCAAMRVGWKVTVIVTIHDVMLGLRPNGAARHKEAFLKACIQPWINEAFAITAKIEAKLAQMQGMEEQMQGSSIDTVSLNIT